jgi:hypothetical protein
MAVTIDDLERGVEELHDSVRALLHVLEERLPALEPEDEPRPHLTLIEGGEELTR